MIFGSIPLGTKVYLEDKSLVKVESLSIGDKVLSLKINDEEIKKPIDFYLKYVKLDNSINKDDLSFSFATISSVNLVKNQSSASTYNNSMYINNPIIANFDNDECNIWDAQNKKSKLKDIDFIKYNNIENFITFKVLGYSEGYVENILSKNIKEIPEKNTLVDFKDTVYYSISLKDNYFYFTENLCLVGIVPEIIGDVL